MALVSSGERSAWRKMEMIRVQTRISTVLDDILREFEEEYVNLHEKSADKAA